MITHGRQQILPPNMIIGRTQIQGACIGREVVLFWLTAATKQAILGAFGQTDGKAVINATNAYLNQLAASDMDKATALAANFNVWIPLYVPEDKDIMYSLVPTLGTRWLVGDGTAYCQLGYTPTVNTIVDLEFQPLSFDVPAGKTYILFFGYQSDNPDSSCYLLGRGMRFGCSGTGEYVYSFYASSTTDLSPKHVIMKNGEYIVNGNTITQFTKFNYLNPRPLYLFYGNRTGNDNAIAKMRFKNLKLIETSTLSKWFIPFKRNGQMELLDLVSGNLATRVGTFTELIDTPSTP